jgi:tetrahydromethanopterin S-methyltransferase subunit A
MSEALALVRDQLGAATATPKCWKCGCLHDTVNSLATSRAAGDLAPVLAAARAAFASRAYDCLGCATCYPAVATNAMVDAYPEIADSLSFCPTDDALPRAGWPPLPGNYRIKTFIAPVAVCTLNSPELPEALVEHSPVGLAIAGTMRTENLGIERLVQNVLANPNIRFLVVCGADTEGTIGHLPGRSLVALHRLGIDDHGRIIDAPGRRPVLENLDPSLVDAFRRRIEVVDLIGESDIVLIASAVARCAEKDPGPATPLAVPSTVQLVAAREPEQLVLDPAGFVVIHGDARTQALVAEHYTNQGVLDLIVDGATPASVMAVLIDRGLVTRLDHAAYLGQELARAEAALRDGRPYVQEKAAGGVPKPATAQGSCGCAGSCPEQRP